MGGTGVSWHPNWPDREGYARVEAEPHHGRIYLRRQLLTPGQWAYVIGHCLLHLGFEHLQPYPPGSAWHAASCAFVSAFLRHLRFGEPPAGVHVWPESATH